jgi:hypothetical protein
MLRGNQAAPGGVLETFDRGQGGFLALGNDRGNNIGWNFQRHIARKVRRIGEGHSDDMSVKSLGNGDSKIAGRIAPDPVLQIDDNILDHRIAPVEAAKPQGHCRDPPWRRP